MFIIYVKFNFIKFKYTKMKPYEDEIKSPDPFHGLQVRKYSRN